MAKEKKDEPVFQEPEFDEKDYLNYERERAKAIVFVFILGALIGILTGYLEVTGLWYIGLLLMIVVLYFLKRLLILIKMSMPRTTWHKVILYGELILTWFLFWIIALNPPFHVVAGPQISNLEVYTNGHWQSVSEVSGLYDIPTGHDELRAYVYYKYHITNVTVSCDSSIISSHYQNDYVYFNVTGAYGNRDLISITADSVRDHTGTFNIYFT
ncbi:hypothetical protein [Picrophilus oshimae]|uniref:Hypothetical membrane protein n=1 Tax=Picrophilus torridus (strain ATCC 700027 / DSM 9790 / JCM 10055 / NBRC 100828 / KAW 2/3) TaxID=1122961 RepID=Q6L268_PICTO|nr:hypothetical protein [Picrophilus oshimae]AAT42934.1 hypothetical membrane protein [Picrophilus oshimae DSM 9789]